MSDISLFNFGIFAEEFARVRTEQLKKTSDKNLDVFDSMQDAPVSVQKEYLEYEINSLLDEYEAKFGEEYVVQ